MDPVDLPEEVIICILTLLSIEDLLNCCLVSSHWREAVNNNIIWKRLCNSTISLENVQCAVSPVFQLPEEVCEDLSPVCKYRLDYMREIHLKNNYKNNRYVEQKHLFTDVDDLHILDRLLIGSDRRADALCVWEIGGNFSKIQTISYVLDYLPLLKCTEKYCVILLQTLLQVYVVKDGKLTLKLCRIVDKEEKFSEDMPTIDIASQYNKYGNPLKSWYESNVGFVNLKTSFEAASNYLIVGISGEFHPKYTLHIWDLEIGNKLKIETLPEFIVDVTCHVSSINLYVGIMCMNELNIKYIILCYSRKSLEHALFCIELIDAHRMYVGEKIIVVRSHDNITNCASFLFIDSATGDKICERQVEKNLCRKTVKICDSRLLYTISNSVTAVDLNTQEDIFKLTVGCGINCLHCIDNNLLLVSGSMSERSTCRTVGIYELWDTKNNCRLHSLQGVEFSKLIAVKQQSHELFLLLEFSHTYVSDYCFRVRNYW